MLVCRYVGPFLGGVVLWNTLKVTCAWIVSEFSMLVYWPILGGMFAVCPT